MFLDSIEMLKGRIDAGLGWSSISCLGRWLLCKLGYSEIMVAHISSRFYFETIPIWLSMAIIFLTLFGWAQKELLLSKGQSRMAFLGAEGISSCFASHCKALVPKWELYFPLNPPWRPMKCEIVMSIPRHVLNKIRLVVGWITPTVDQILQSSCCSSWSKPAPTLPGCFPKIGRPPFHQRSPNQNDLSVG